MIRSSESAFPDASGFNCWKENPNCLALRVEPEDGGIFLLPYRHLALSHFELKEDGEQLALLFATHAVLVKGRKLRDLLPALQKESVQWLRTIPERYEAAQGSEDMAIFSIKVDNSERLENE